MSDIEANDSSPEVLRDGDPMVSQDLRDDAASPLLAAADDVDCGLTKAAVAAAGLSRESDKEGSTINILDVPVLIEDASDASSMAFGTPYNSAIAELEKSGGGADQTGESGVLIQQTPEYNAGPPGSTPFPHRNNPKYALVGGNGVSEDVSGGFVGCSSPIETPNRSGTSHGTSMTAPPVPFNSPDDGLLEEMLKAEAKKQERNIKQRLEDNNLMNLFKTPERAPGALRPRKRLREVMKAEDEERGDDEAEKARGARAEAAAAGGLAAGLELMTREERISPYNSEETSSERENARRARINASLELLKKIVPGAQELTDKTDLYEVSAKYILYLKRKVGSTHDRDFLKEFLPY